MKQEVPAAEEKLVSIIVPIYNAEKYLKQCIESILQQKFAMLELILVNDGSTDESLEICREYARCDRRIKVIDKKNTGVSDTRNVGIDNACGKYVQFVDADDYLKEGALEHIEKALRRDSYPDMLIWGFSSVGERAIANDTKLLENNRAGFEAQELLSKLLSIEEDDRFLGFVWRSTFKRSMLNEHSIRFCPKLKMSEDYKFLLDALMVSGHVSVLKEELYVYRANEGSATARYKPNVYRDISWINQWAEQKVKTMYPELLPKLEEHCAETYIVALQNWCNPGTEYNILERIGLARTAKKECCYGEKAKSVLNSGVNLTKRRRFVFGMIKLNLEAIYILLYSAKRKTLW